jgi:hypothetical protein
VAETPAGPGSDDETGPGNPPRSDDGAASSADHDETLLYQVAPTEFPTDSTGFDPLPTRGGVILRGPCPRCRDLMEFLRVTRSVKATFWRRERSRPRGEDGSRPRRDPSVVPMICTCNGVHPGRPEGEYGCGAYWTITLRPAEGRS